MYATNNSYIQIISMCSFFIFVIIYLVNKQAVA